MTIRQIMISAATAVALWASAVSCEKEPVIDLRDITFAEHASMVVIGQTMQLTPEYSPADYNHNIPTTAQVWTTSDSTIATVSQTGEVKGVGAGRVYITLTWGGFERSTLLDIDGPTSIADNLFMAFCLDHFDADRDGVLRQIETCNVVGMDLTELSPYHRVISLSGLKYFAALKNLTISGLDVSDVDFSNNPHLHHLVCDNSNLTHLDLSTNHELEELDCHSCADLGSIILPTEPSRINTIACFGCALTTLDLSQSPMLEYLDCRFNNIAELDTSACPLLEQLEM